MKRMYCPTCRSDFVATGDDASCPPYAVVHVTDTAHLHPQTRNRVERVPDEEEEAQ